MSSEFVISGATVVDGTGAPGQIADVRVAGDRIVEVGPDLGRGADVVAGDGMILAPGFIDTHSHDDYAVVLYPEMAFKVCGGVTTVVVGNCGHGAAPLDSGDGFVELIHPGASLPEWRGFDGYLGHLDENPSSVNVAPLVGHGTLRASVMGMDDREPTKDELDEMKSLLAEGLAAGWFGLSTGLVYPPSKFAKTDEVVELASAMSEHGGIYASHIRNEDSRLLEAVAEAIEIGERAGVKVVVSHVKAAGKENFGMVEEALKLIDAAGPAVAGDQYPYTAGSTGLAAVMSGSIGKVAPADVVIASTASHPEWHGRSLLQIAEDTGASETEVGHQILESEPSATVVVHMMDEDDVVTGLRHPELMVGSDGVPTLDGQPHPRLYGTFARVLGRYSRDLGVLPLETAIHKMSGRAAEVFGIEDRGSIRPGAFADMVLFDADAITDRGTYEDPHQFPDGIARVWVNGVSVVENGSHSGARPGKALRRS